MDNSRLNCPSRLKSSMWLLPGWTIPGFGILAVLAGKRIPKRVRLFADYPVNHFTGVK